MIIKSLIALLATSALATKLVQHLSRKNEQRRVRADHQRHHDDVTRWEGEGGNLPVKPQR
ncbi:hypothetical protein [Roseateles sp. P5_E7]